MSLRTQIQHHFRKNLRRARLISQSIVDIVRFYLLPVKPIDISRPGKKTYVFLCHDLAPHFARMVKWLVRKEGIHPVLLVVHKGNFSIYNSEYFDEIYTYRTLWDVRRMVRNLRGHDVIYASGAVAWPIRAAIEYSGVPVIFDVKDTYIVNYGFNPPQLYMKLDLENERYALAHSAGIVSQSIEAYFAYRYYGIQKRPPTLFFPLYCDDDYCVENIIDRRSDEIHVVYVGGVYGSSANKAHFGNEIFFDLIDQFTEQRIHFHLYPAPTISQAVVQEYEDYTKKTPFLHVHKPVPQAQLASEISQYHFGIVPFFNERTTRMKAKRERATALKVFNYLEAGLPVLISNHCEFEKWMVARYGVAIGLEERDLDRIRTLVESLNYSDARKSVLEKRKKILLGYHIPRLASFCSDCMEKQKPDNA